MGIKFGVEASPKQLLVALYGIFESWVASYDDDAKPRVQPKDHPDRREIIMVIGNNITGQQNMAIIAIGRNDRNGIVPGKIKWSLSGAPDMPKIRDRLLPAFVAGYTAALALR